MASIFYDELFPPFLVSRSLHPSVVVVEWTPTGQTWINLPVPCFHQVKTSFSVLPKRYGLQSAFKDWLLFKYCRVRKSSTLKFLLYKCRKATHPLQNVKSHSPSTYSGASHGGKEYCQCELRFQWGFFSFNTFLLHVFVCHLILPPPPPLLNQDVSLPSDDLEIQHRRLPCPVVHSDNKLSHIRFCICTYVDHFQDSLLRAYFGFRFRQQKLSTRLNDKNHAISLWYFFQYRWKAICMNIGSWGSYFFKNGTEHCRQKPSIAIAIPLAWARQVWHLR